MNILHDILALTAPRAFEKHAANHWKAEAVAQLGPDISVAEIEMSATQTMDSSGLAALIALNELMVKRGGEVRLVNPSKVVTQLLELTRLHRVFIIVGSSSTARSFAERPILIAEDESIIRTVAKMSLTPLGREILFAENGHEALIIARRDRPAVILLDYLMPLMDGTETLRQLKLDDTTKDIPVIVMSANEKISSGAHDSFAGAACFISKPFNPSVLRNEVHNLIQEHREVAA